MDCLFLAADSGPRLTPETRAYWLPRAGQGGWTSLQACAEGIAGAVALVLPAEVCSFFAVTLPTRKTRWVQQALAYAVEELLAESVDDLHLALGETLDDGRDRVIAIRRRLLADWLEDLRALGLDIVAVHVDADLLPRDGAQLLFLDERALLGGSPEPRLAFPTAQWPMLAAQCPSPRFGHGTLAEAPGELDGYEPVEDPYRWLAGGREEAVNLAQGEFAVRPAGTGLGRWKPVLAVLGLILLVQLGFNLAQGWYFQRQGDHYAAASEALYRELFPEDVRIVNLRAQFADHIGQRASASAGLMRLLEHAATAAEGMPVTIGQLDYSDGQGALAMQVQAQDFSTLEALRQRLAETGQPVELGSASRDGDGVSARVVIGG
ncbi:type II secretion system protein GspL [Stutzerimonas azotifigens]|uniref:type II secretion system protein GspL n=1 Tax=Stutzerimonas azotifigens TaxID=291995 RepID=UPI00041FBAE2|nr:type II secretion system protein GspL [Stutzerimonas azotifigens]